MVYNWPHGTNVEIGPELFDRLVDIHTVVAIKDSTPDADQFFETTRRVVGRARVFGPFMTVRGLEMLSRLGGDGFIGGGSLFGPADAQFWRRTGAGISRRARNTPAATRNCSRNSGCPAAGPVCTARIKVSSRPSWRCSASLAASPGGPGCRSLTRGLLDEILDGAAA